MVRHLTVWRIDGCSLSRSRLKIVKYFNRGMKAISTKNWDSGGVNRLDLDSSNHISMQWQIRLVPNSEHLTIFIDLRLLLYYGFSASKVALQIAVSQRVKSTENTSASRKCSSRHKTETFLKNALEDHYPELGWKNGTAKHPGVQQIYRAVLY